MAINELKIYQKQEELKENIQKEYKVLRTKIISMSDKEKGDKYITSSAYLTKLLSIKEMEGYVKALNDVKGGKYNNG